MSSRWVEVSVEDLRVGDLLRVKRDAYLTDAGTLHNGRTVQVTKIADGDVYVKTIDKNGPEIHEARHPPYKLEKES